MIRLMLRMILRMAVLVVLAAAALYVWHRAYPPEGPAGLPGKTAAPAAGPSRPVGSPEPDFLLRHAPDLGLSPEQTERLRKLDEGFRQKAGPVRKELDEAGKKLADELNRLSNRKIGLPDVQERSRLFRDLSKRLAELREAAWREEEKVLTPEQRKRAKDAWAKVHRLLPGGAAPEKSDKDRKGGGG
jgi:hypothetical protein